MPIGEETRRRAITEFFVADCGDLAFQLRRHPDIVCVQERYPISSGNLDAFVSGSGKTGVLLIDVFTGYREHYLLGIVFRAIIHDDDLVGSHSLVESRFNALWQPLHMVVGWNNDRNLHARDQTHALDCYCLAVLNHSAGCANFLS